MSYSDWDFQGRVNNLSFNQDHGVFTCSMDNGIRMYNVEPLMEQMRLYEQTVGSVSLCEMLHRTNMVAVVGYSGPKQKFADNTVVIWDDNTKKMVLDFTFDSSVLGVRLKNNRLFVALKSTVQVYSFPTNPQKLFSFSTGANPRGLLEVSPFPSSERQVLVFPGSYTGSIQIVDLSKINSTTTGAPIVIKAHHTEIACMALNGQGTLVATASIKGTLIRVFDTISKQKVIELRRGSDKAAFYCINFSADSDFLCASSDKGTVHIFALRQAYLNKRLPFTNKLPSLGSYVSESQWAFANFTVQQENKCICAFGSNSSVVAVCTNGDFFRYVYTSDGSCNRESYDQYLDICDDFNFF